MQHRTYSRQLFIIVALLGCIIFNGGCSLKTVQVAYIIFNGGCCLKTVRAVYSSGSESSDASQEEVCSSSEEDSACRSEVLYTDDEKKSYLEDLVENFCKILNKLQKDLANCISTAYVRGALTEETMQQQLVDMSNCMFNLVSVAFNAIIHITKLKDTPIVLNQFKQCFSDALVFVSKLQAAQIVPSQFVRFFSCMLAFIDRLYTVRLSPVEILEYLIAQLNKAQNEWLKKEIKQQASECPICLSRLKGSLIVLPCHPTHVFHNECIRVWVAHEIPSPYLPSLCKWCRSFCLKYFYQFNKPSCPLCKQNFNPIDLGLISDCSQMPT